MTDALPCANCATVMFDSEFGRCCTKHHKDDKCNHCIATDSDCVPVPKHLQRNLTEMVHLLQRYQHGSKDVNGLIALHESLECMEKDFNQMMAEHDFVSKAKALVVFGYDGTAQIKHDFKNSAPDDEEGKGPAMDLLVRIANRMDAQAKATERLHEKVNGVIKMMSSLTDSRAEAFELAATLPSVRPHPSDNELVPQRPPSANLNNGPDEDSNVDQSRTLRLIDFFDSNGRMNFPWHNERPEVIEERKRQREIKTQRDRERFAQMRKDVNRRVAEESIMRRKRLFDEMNEE